MPKARPTLYEQLREEERESAELTAWWGGRTARWIVIVVAILGVALFLPGRTGQRQSAGEDRTMLGTVWLNETITAEFSYPVRKSESALRTEREQARSRAIPVVVPASAPQLTVTEAVRRSMNGQAMDDATAKGLEQRTRGIVDAVRTGLRSMPIVFGGTAVTSAAVISIRTSATSERLLDRASFVDSLALIRRIERYLPASSTRDDRIVLNAVMLVLPPTYVVHDGLTARAREEAEASVRTTAEIVHAGDVIVRKGERIDERILLKIASYRDAQYVRSTPSISWLVVLGSIMHGAVIVSIICLYLYFLRPRSLKRIGQLATLLGLPVIVAGLAWLTVAFATPFPLEYLVLVPALSMVIAVLYDGRAAFAVTVSMALAVAGVRGNDHALGLAMLTAGTLAAYTVNNLQSRTQIFTSIISIFVSLVVTILAIDLERSTPFMLSLEKIVLSTLNAVISPLLAFGIILLFERLMNTATDLRLAEFDTLEHPLLVQLNERAPGTYQHTLAVARLSEAAAAAIGANALLAKVGAYYHDIGKLEKAEYFVENQLDIDNKHDRLPPKRSASIIRQHVQDGIELARAKGLPERIWRFIPMHHGTILIRHFYALAVAEAQTRADGSTVDPMDFRYPGPKPDSKEAAIVMLADASEALSRTVDASDRDALDAAVQSIIMDRMQDGQLDDAALTTHDLTVIRDSFVRNLVGRAHTRIAYRGIPDQTSPS
jgi:hypothetical protein